MKSKFRNLFIVRILFGFIVFVLGFIYLLNGILNFNSNLILPLVMVSVFLLFLIYVSIDLLKVFSIKLNENGFQKKIIISRRKKEIAFKDILKIESQKTRLRDTRLIDISDGYSFSILKLENEEDLIISPDYYENYNKIMEFIKSKINKL